MNGDLITTVDVEDMLSHHVKSNALISISCGQLRTQPDLESLISITIKAASGDFKKSQVWTRHTPT